MVLPILKYPGGKMRELPIIRQALPNFTNYYEPFLGGGAVWLNVEANHYFVNDFSSDLMNLYQLIQERNTDFERVVLDIDNLWNIDDEKEFIIRHSELLTSECNSEDYLREIGDRFLRKLLPFPTAEQVFSKCLSSSFLRKQRKYSRMCREEIVGLEDIAVTVIKDSIYLTVRELYNTTQDRIYKTAYYWFLREFSYSSMFRFNSNGGFNVPYGGKSYNNKSLVSKLTQSLSVEVSEKLNNTTLSNNDFQVFMDRFTPTQDDFVFLDPPYDSDFSTYDQNEFSFAEQTRLAGYLKNNLRASFMLVIKETDFIRNLYTVGEHTVGGNGEIFVTTFEKKYQVSFKNRNNRNANHLIITNYEVE